jgi:hypothetical protein
MQPFISQLEILPDLSKLLKQQPSQRNKINSDQQDVIAKHAYAPTCPTGPGEYSALYNKQRVQHEKWRSRHCQHHDSGTKNAQEPSYYF